jgi:Pyridoxamine 5'-phosphate oxidase
MGKVFEGIDEALGQWLTSQPVFFVATAPLAADGLVNCSPNGLLGTFALLDARTVAYLDLTGSGIETVAHLRENGRIVLMFCAFDGRPRIVRLHGTGRVVLPGDDPFDALAGRFSSHPGVRSVIVVELSRISDSCGYAVPRLGYVGDRDVLDLDAAKKGPEQLAAYRAERNATSLDGLPGLPVLPVPAPAAG